MGERVNFSGDETWQTWCHLAQNFIRIPKLSISAREAPGVGRKMTGKLIARLLQASSWGHVTCCLAARPPTSTCHRLLELLSQRVRKSDGRNDDDREVQWLGRKERKKKK